MLISKNYTFVSYFYEILNDMTKKEKFYTQNQERVAAYAKALSHPARVFIMNYLSSNLDKCCYSGDMATELPIARSTLSKNWETAKILFKDLLDK